MTTKTVTPADILSAMRSVPDFPQKGIIFKDITPVLADPFLFKGMIKLFADQYRGKGIKKIIGIESRGFLLASALACELNAGLVLVRKKGKLPAEKISETYALEYGTDTLEMHSDSVGKGEKVIIIDDVLATGGTVSAVVRMVNKMQGDLYGVAVLMELEFLKGRAKLDGVNLFSMIKS
ncbi:MAG: adenine phosphoribosyltransferase [Elusimicrobiaceae bacterium]|jgi:adenine phosphoribosyltransferase